MEPNVEPTTPEPDRTGLNPASVAHQPRLAVPVMDVVPPQAIIATTPAVTSAPSQTTVAESMPVTPAPSENGDDLLASEIQTPQTAGPEPGPAHAALPPKRHNGTTTAIVITIVVFVVLSALAIFAYLQSR